MPNYDFKCTTCDKVFDAIVTIKDMNKSIKCACGGAAKRIFSCGLFGLTFKGTGFYETDYKRKETKKKEATPVKESSEPYESE